MPPDHPRSPLAESECRTGGYFLGAVSDRLAEECQILVRVHNLHVSNPDSDLTGTVDEHPILTWGAPGNFIDCAASSCGAWAGVSAESIGDGSEMSITRLDFSDNDPPLRTGGFIYLAGEIQEELCQLTRLTYLNLSGSRFTGTIPECLGRLPNLRTLSVADNRLSGSVPASIAESTTLNWFAADDNNLTGALPAGFNQAYYISLSGNSLSENLPAALGRADGYTVYLDLSDNQFSGEIPSAWISRFTKVNVFDLANNNLRGTSSGNWINDWLNAIEFVDTQAQPEALFSLENNQICYSSLPALAGGQPRPFDTGGSFTGGYSDGGSTLSRSSSGGSSAVFRLSGQTCLLGAQQHSNLLMPAISNLVLDVVVKGSGLEIASNWTPPSAGGMTYTPPTYAVELNWNPETDRTNNGCLTPLVTHIPVRTVVDLVDRSILLEFVSGPQSFSGRDISFTNSSFTMPILLAAAENQNLCRDLFERYFIEVAPVYEVSQGGVTNAFRGTSRVFESSGGNREPVDDDNQNTVLGWRVFNVTVAGAGKDASQIARDLEVPEDETAYSWDAANQAWVAHPAQGDSGNLAAGTALMYQLGVFSEADLEAAGVSRADENIVVTLHQGWNLLAPVLEDVDGDGAADDFDDRSQAASLFDGSLTDCDNLAGVLAIVAYDMLTKEFGLYLPCHGDLAVPGYGQLDEINRLNSLFIFFRSELPVPITWDPADAIYTPNV